MFETLLQEPASEPISVEQLAVSARFDAPDATVGSPPAPNLEYLYVEEQITAAREQVERLSHYCFMTQKWRLTLDSFPTLYVGVDQYTEHFNVPFPSPFRPDAIELLRFPVQSVESVNYIDGNGNEQVVDETIYDVKGGRVILKVGMSWPIMARVPDAVWVDYTAGYNPDGSPPVKIPARFLKCLKFLAGWYFEARLPVGTEPTQSVQRALDDLLTGFRSSYMPR